MATLFLRFFILVFLLWLLQRLLSKVLRPSRPNAEGQSPAASPNNMVKDPVCGMYMDSRLAIRMEKRKETLYFCSEDCKNKYLGKGTEEAGAQNSPTV